VIELKWLGKLDFWRTYFKQITSPIGKPGFILGTQWKRFTKWSSRVRREPGDNYAALAVTLAAVSTHYRKLQPTQGFRCRSIFSAKGRESL